MLVSHDFRLIDQVAKDIWVCEKQVGVMARMQPLILGEGTAHITTVADNNAVLAAYQSASSWDPRLVLGTGALLIVVLETRTDLRGVHTHHVWLPHQPFASWPSLCVPLAGCYESPSLSCCDRSAWFACGPCAWQTNERQVLVAFSVVLTEQALSCSAEQRCPVVVLAAVFADCAALEGNHPGIQGTLGKEDGCGALKLCGELVMPCQLLSLTLQAWRAMLHSRQVVCQLNNRVCGVLHGLLWSNSSLLGTHWCSLVC